MTQQLLPDEVIQIIADKYVNMPNKNLLYFREAGQRFDPDDQTILIEIKIADQEQYIYLLYGYDTPSGFTCFNAEINNASIQSDHPDIISDKLILHECFRSWKPENISAKEMLCELQDSKELLHSHLSEMRDGFKPSGFTSLLSYIDQAINTLMSEYFLLEDLIKYKMND